MNDNLLDIIRELSVQEIDTMTNLIKSVKTEKVSKLNESYTLFNFTQSYKEYVSSSLSEKYLKSVNQSFKHLLKYFGEEKNIADISVKEAEEFKMYLVKLAPRGHLVYLRTIKSSFNRAIEWEYIQNNPFNRIRIRNAQLNKPIFLSLDELKVILDNTESEFMKNVFTFGFYSGCRVGEIANLKWSNIDFENEVITIGDNTFTTKGRKQRVIPMIPQLKKVLTDLYKNRNENHQFVFSKETGYHYCSEYFSKKFKVSLRKAGMDDSIVFHTLRHSFGSNLANEGVPLNVVQELMGHTSPLVTARYMHTNLSNLKRGMEVFNNLNFNVHHS